MILVVVLVKDSLGEQVPKGSSDRPGCGCKALHRPNDGTSIYMYDCTSKSSIRRHSYLPSTNSVLTGYIEHINTCLELLSTLTVPLSYHVDVAILHST